MAKVAFALPIDAIRGKLGGLVFSANKSGPFVKPFRQPAYVINEKIQSQRILIAAIPSAWRALSGAQRTAWNTWAALPAQAKTDSLGNTYYLNGYQQYVRIATYRFNCIYSLPTAAPTIAIPTAPVILSMIAYYPQSVPYQCACTFAAGSFTAGNYVMISAAVLPSEFATTCYNGYRQIEYFTTPQEDPSAFSLRYAVSDAFGNLIVGAQLFIHVYQLTTEFVPSMASLCHTTILAHP